MENLDFTPFGGTKVSQFMQSSAKAIATKI